MDCLYGDTKDRTRFYRCGEWEILQSIRAYYNVRLVFARGKVLCLFGMVAFSKDERVRHTSLV